MCISQEVNNTGNSIRMKIYTPLGVIIRFILYVVLLFGAAEMVRFDALYPMEEGYYGEISYTEFSQEAIFLLLTVFYFIAGYRYREIQPVTNILSLVFLASFIREFNFIISWWFYLVLPVIFIIIWLLFRDYRKLKRATETFFFLPSSGWLLSGFLITFLFSRLMGRSSFWRILYDENSYRIAKAAAEEGMELAGDVLMLISVAELFLAIHYMKKKNTSD